MSMSARGVRASPRTTWLLEFVSQFVFFAVPIGVATAAAVLLFYQQDVLVTEQSLHEAERDRLHLRVALIRNGVEEATTELRLLAALLTQRGVDDTGPAAERALLQEGLQSVCLRSANGPAARIATAAGETVVHLRCVDGRPIPLRGVAGTGATAAASPAGDRPPRWGERLAGLSPGDVAVSGLSAPHGPDAPADGVRTELLLTTPLGTAAPAARRYLELGVDLRGLLPAQVAPADRPGSLVLTAEDGRWIGLAGAPQGQGTATERADGRAPAALLEALRAGEQGTLETPAGLFTFAALHLGAPGPRGAPAGTGAAPSPVGARWALVSHVPRAALDAGRMASARRVGLLIPAPLLVTLYLAHMAVRRRRASRGLEESERYLRQIMDSMVDAILTTDGAGRIERVNAATVGLFGFASQHAVPASLGDLLPLHRLPPEGELARLWRGDASLRPDGSGKTERPLARGRLDVRRSDGTGFPAELVLMQAELGGELRFVWIVRDISERQAFEAKQTAERMRFFHQTKMAEIGLIAAGIIHEVGNPIAAIAGMVSELSEEARQGKAAWSLSGKEHLKLIGDQVERLAGITREISDFVRTRPGVVELFDFNALIRRTVRLVQYDSRWRAIRLELELDPTLPALLGIQDQLAQVLMNLLVNAGDAVEAESPESRRVTVRSENRGTHVHLLVRDTGHGMSAAAKRHAFDSFFTTKPEGKGTGLGLTLCQMIVTAHRGEIAIDSDVGRGAAIHVSLPVPGQADTLAS